MYTVLHTGLTSHLLADSMKFTKSNDGRFLFQLSKPGTGLKTPVKQPGKESSVDKDKIDDITDRSIRTNEQTNEKAF